RISAQAGIKPRRVGRPGPGGYWVWERIEDRPADVGLHDYGKGRGFYSKLWVRGGVGLVQKKLGNDRETALAKLAQLKAEYGVGQHEPAPADRTPKEPVFLTRRGRPWKKAMLSTRMQRARARCRLPACVVLYKLRHAFAHRGVRSKVHLKQLALALGHVDTRMIERWYTAGLAGDVELIVDAVEQMFGRKGGRE